MAESVIDSLSKKIDQLETERTITIRATTTDAINAIDSLEERLKMIVTLSNALDNTFIRLSEDLSAKWAEAKQKAIDEFAQTVQAITGMIPSEKLQKSLEFEVRIDTSVAGNLLYEAVYDWEAIMADAAQQIEDKFTEAFTNIRRQFVNTFMDGFSQVADEAEAFATQLTAILVDAGLEANAILNALALMDFSALADSAEETAQKLVDLFYNAGFTIEQMFKNLSYVDLSDEIMDWINKLWLLKEAGEEVRDAFDNGNWVDAVLPYDETEKDGEVIKATLEDVKSRLEELNDSRATVSLETQTTVQETHDLLNNISEILERITTKNHLINLTLSEKVS
jgi:hypothetical protein